MPTITKKELVDRIAENTQTKHLLVTKIIQDFLDIIVTELSKNNRIEFRCFGVFEPKMHQARMAQNPKTLERIQVPARRTVKFKAGRLMKQKLNVMR